MARIQTIPNETMRDIARSKGVDPFEYVKTRTRRIDNSDMRLKGKYGEYMEDFLIERSDNSRVVIHEATPDVEGFIKLEINEMDERGRLGPKVVAYAEESFDLKKMQVDSAYLDVVSDGMLSKSRIESKQNTQNARSTGFIYVGTIIKDRITGQYKKAIRNLEPVVVSNIMSQKQRLSQRDNEQQRRSEMISAIQEGLKGLSNEELSQICVAMGISLDKQDREGRD